MGERVADIEVIKSDTLTEVSEETYNGVSCIRLSFEKSGPRYMDLQLNNSRQKYELAQNLVGEIVKVFAWDPDNEPGKWSSRGWFTDIVPVTIVKGSCTVCGVADDLLTYSEDFGKSWTHYRCKFPV